MYDRAADRVATPQFALCLLRRKLPTRPGTWPELGERWPEPTC